ncbi:MAG: hypothetical protein HZA58_07715 [Acidimicrobiia bacterium]|nr:hypothetical protein [Acidimicrobiia bacterium]
MRRSWIDTLVQWGTTRRIPWWALVAGFWAIDLLLMSAVKWWDGSLQFGHLYERSVDSFYGFAGLCGYGILAHAARTAFDRFRPALEISDEKAAGLRDRLSTMSFRAGLVVAALGSSLGIVALLSDRAMVDLVSTSLAATLVITGLAYVANVALVVVGIVQLVRQVVQVARLHRRADRIDVFHPEPAHAFSRLTARGGTLILVIVGYGMLTDPTTFTNPVWFVGSAVGLVLAVVTFFFPLRGMHRRLRDEKLRLLDRSTTRIRAVSADLHRAVDGGSYESVAELRGVLDALDLDRGRIKAASSWPWEHATLRGFATTLVVPVAIWFVTAVLGKSLGL